MAAAAILAHSSVVLPSNVSENINSSSSSSSFGEGDVLFFPPYTMEPHLKRHSPSPMVLRAVWAPTIAPETVSAASSQTHAG